MGNSKYKLKREWPCPTCGQPLGFEDTGIAEISAYCIKCGYRLVVTNTDLAARVAEESPIRALRMLVDGLQWANICKALSGKAILIPGKDHITTKHRHVRHAKRASRYSEQTKSAIVSMKQKGMKLKDIAAAMGIPYSTVVYFAYRTSSKSEGE